MAKYTAKDDDVENMYDHDRVDYDVFLLDYDVDASGETAQGKAVLQMMHDTIQQRKFQPIKNVYNIYTVIFAFLIALAFVLLIAIIVLIIVVFFIMIFTKKEPFKQQLSIKLNLLIKVLVFFFGIMLLIYIFTKIKDTAQTNLEKIIYVL